MAKHTAKKPDVSGLPVDSETKKEGLKLKDVVSLVLSTLAFAVSGGTAYYNIIRETDDLRVVISSTPSYRIDEGLKRAAAFGDLSMVFINSGNRAAAIVRVVLEVGQPGGGLGECGGSYTSIVVDLEPFVVKEKEIVTKWMTLKTKSEGFGYKLETDGAISFPLTEENLKRDTLDFDTCLNFFAATPSNAEVTTRLFVKGLRYAKAEGADLRGGTDVVVSKPRTIVHERGSIFTRGRDND